MVSTVICYALLLAGGSFVFGFFMSLGAGLASRYAPVSRNIAYDNLDKPNAKKK